MQTFESMVDEWITITAQIRELGRREISLRMALFGAAFPDPKEGVNKVEIADGRIFKGTYAMSRYIPAEGQRNILEGYPLLNLNTPLDTYVNQPVQYSSSKLKDAPLAVAELIAENTTVKPGTPKIEVL